MSGAGVGVSHYTVYTRRVVYVIAEPDKAIDVLAVRRRPPYDYGDLAVLLKELI